MRDSKLRWFLMTLLILCAGCNSVAPRDLSKASYRTGGIDYEYSSDTRDFSPRSFQRATAIEQAADCCEYVAESAMFVLSLPYLYVASTIYFATGLGGPPL